MPGTNAGGVPGVFVDVVCRPPVYPRITLSPSRRKPLRLELLTTKAEVDGRLEGFSLTWTDCGRKVHGVGRTPERRGIGDRDRAARRS
jgi:hypothetical protein